MVFLLPKIPEAIDAARVTACKKNLQEIYSGFVMYDTKHKDLPKEGGAQVHRRADLERRLEQHEDDAEACPARRSRRAR
jgi:hypothetical protein